MIIDTDGTHDSHGYRSTIERHVAEELQRLNIEFGYEEPWTNPHTGKSVPYLPDFTIRASSRADEFELPKWVEVKPQQMIYDLFEDLGLKRKYSAWFTEPIGKPLTSNDLQERQFHELRKPKRLAELSGESVLVVGTVRATARLSVEMRPDLIVFSRSHPFVNQRGIEKELEKERRRAENEARWRAYEQERAARNAREQAERQRDAAARCRLVMQRSALSVPPRFNSRCEGCGIDGADGSVYGINTQSGQMEWFRICIKCQMEHL